jgi:hypothetical protein
MVQRQSEPVSILWGKIPSDKDKFSQLHSSNVLEVVEIHQVKGFFMIVLNDLRIYELKITEKVMV